MSTKVARATTYAAKLINLADNKPTLYRNWWPDNCGYVHSNGFQSWDCICLVKAPAWDFSILDATTPGRYAIARTDIIPDCRTDEILDYCTEVGTNMEKIPIGAVLTYKGGGHVGVYVGGGHVVEATMGWGQNRVVKSDIDGRGHSSFRGVQRGSWAKWGKLQCFEYIPEWEKGDLVVIKKNAKIYGTDQQFIPSVYGMVLNVREQNDERVVVYSGEDWCIGAVSAYDLEAAPAEPQLPPVIEPDPEPIEPSEPDEPAEPPTEEPSEPTEPPEEDPKPPVSDEEDAELDKQTNWFLKFITATIKGIFEVIRDLFGPKENT